MAKISIEIDDAIYEKIDAFLKKNTKVSYFCINVNYNRYIVDIKMKRYSVDNADSLYRDFVKCAAYPYSHISVRYNEDSRVRYRFVTCREDKKGLYMDVIISE